MSAVIIKEYAAPPINRREILRYMGCRQSSPEVDELIERALLLCDGKLAYKVCFAEFDLRIDGDICDLTFAKVKSRDLSKCLAGCEKVIVFGATVGLELDRLILRYGKAQPSLSVSLQAIGAERIEALCDEFCIELKQKYAAEGKYLRPRFSAGYGDLPLEFQREIFASLLCEKQIGLTLNDSLIMSPTKSVTAIIGIY